MLMFCCLLQLVSVIQHLSQQLSGWLSPLVYPSCLSKNCLCGSEATDLKEETSPGKQEPQGKLLQVFMCFIFKIRKTG